VASTQEEYALSLLPSLLINPIRIPGVTCAVCAEPTGGLLRCRVCESHIARWGNALADRVVPLTYASDQVSRQVRYDLRQYKDGERAGGVAGARLSYVVWYSIHRHGRCVTMASDARPTAVIPVPSGAAPRHEGHPLLELAKYFGLPIVTPVRTRPARAREVDPDSLRIDDDLRGQHVIVFDDTWTTGSSAQATAVAARRAGATEVTIMVIGRWVNGSWAPTSQLFSTSPPPQWRPDVCPVTGTLCAAP